MRNQHNQQQRDLRNILWKVNAQSPCPWRIGEDFGLGTIKQMIPEDKKIAEACDFFPPSIVNLVGPELATTHRSGFFENRLSAFRKAALIGLTVKELNDLSEEIWHEVQSSRVPCQMRHGETRDNKDQIVYKGGHSNPNKIRYPRKARKTAWKRFYKLFPHLKPSTNNAPILQADRRI
jgi:hypothetical protein